MNNQPLDKGRIVYAADSYQSNELDQNGQPKTKYRYATLGRATKWQGDNGGEQIELELDSIPLKAESPLKLKIFWDSQQSQQQQPQQAQQQGGFNQQQPQQQMPPHVANAQGGWQNNQ